MLHMRPGRLARPGVIALTVSAALLGGCGEDSPTTPVDEGPDVGTLEFTGGPVAEFLPFGSYIDFNEDLVWVAAAPAARATETLRLEASVSPVNRDVADWVRLSLGESVWEASVLSGVAGCSFVGSQIVFDDCVLEWQGLEIPEAPVEDVSMLGTLDRPREGLTPPSSPLELTVTPLTQGLLVDWSRGGLGVLHTVYLAAEPGIGPDNAGDLVDGAAYEPAEPPFTIPDALTPGIVYFVTVTGTNLAGEGEVAPIVTVAAGGAPDPGVIAFSGPGAGSLASASFVPETVGPGIADPMNDYIHYWLDVDGTRGVLLVGTGIFDADMIEVVLFKTETQVWSAQAFRDDLGAISRDGYRFVLDGLALPQVVGGSDPLVLTGTVVAVPMSATPAGGDLGSLVLDGSISMTIAPTDRGFVDRSARWTLGSSIDVEVVLSHEHTGATELHVRSGSSVWSAESVGSIPGITVNGEEVVVTDVSVTGPGGTLVANGTLRF